MKDLYEICEAIKEHLPEGCKDGLKVGKMNGFYHVAYNDWYVVRLNDDGTFDNEWTVWNESNGIRHIKLEDIFEETGRGLTEIKVKPVESSKNTEVDEHTDVVEELKDLYEICEAIAQHLPEECRDKLVVEQDYDGGSITYDDWSVVSRFDDGTFDNDWENWHEHVGIEDFKLEDVFEEVGDDLSEIKVKPVENIEKEAMYFPNYSELIITDAVTGDEISFDMQASNVSESWEQALSDFSIQGSSPTSDSIYDCQPESCGSDILLHVNIVKTTGDEMKDMAKRLYGADTDGYAYSGMYVKMHNTIYLNSEMDMHEACRTVKHELGHYTLDKTMSGAVVVNEETMCDLLTNDMFMTNYYFYGNLATTYIAQNWEEL